MLRKIFRKPHSNDWQICTKNHLFYQSLFICFLVPEKRIIFAKIQRRKKGKIRLSYHLSFKLLVINWSNMLASASKQPKNHCLIPNLNT